MPQLHSTTFMERHRSSRSLWTRTYLRDRDGIADALARMVDEFAVKDWTLYRTDITRNLGTKRKPNLLHGEQFSLKFETNTDLQRVALALFGTVIERKPDHIWSIIHMPNIYAETYSGFLTYLKEAA